MRPKALVAWSSGKDSAFALHAARVSGTLEIVGLLTTLTEDYGRVSMHGVREEILNRQAEALGLPVGLSLVGCVGLGVGLGYLLEPQGGPQRRAWLREKALTYWQSTENLLSSAITNGAHPPEHRRREEAHTAHQA